MISAGSERVCVLESMLPMELRIQICTYLAAVEVDKGIGVACRAFRNEIESSVSLWKEYCLRTGKLRLPLKVSLCKHAEQQAEWRRHQNPYLMHYYRLPCLPEDFQSMESALVTVMSGEKIRRDEQNNDNMHRHHRSTLGNGKIIVVATYITKQKDRIIHRVAHHRRRSPSNYQSSTSSSSSRNGRKKSEEDVRINFARGNVVSEEKARSHWMRKKSELESLVNMHSRVVRVLTDGEDEGLWMYCRVF